MALSTTKNKNDGDHLSKALVSAITNEIPIAYGDAAQIDSSIITHAEHKLIISTWASLFEVSDNQPSANDLAFEVRKECINQGRSEADSNQLADKIEDGNAWGKRPSSKQIGVAIDRFTNSSPTSNNLVLFKDLHPIRNTPLATYENLNTLVTSLGVTPAINMMDLTSTLLKNGKPMLMSEERVRSFLISEALKAGLSKDIVSDHLIALSEQNSFHPVRHWLESSVWDGTKRVDAVINCMNPKNLQLTTMGMKRWLIGCVASLYAEKFMSKFVLVLQGDQSFMKTAFISRIASVCDGAFLEGAELNPDKKDSVLSCIQSWITELGELERTSKNSQGSLKAFITKEIDTVRPPYGRCDVHKKRQTSLIASVNDEGSLRDDTGSKRFGIIELSKAVNVDELNSILGWSWNNGNLSLVAPDNLLQFWLEVKHWFDSGETWHLSSKELALFEEVNKKHQFKSSVRIELEEKFLLGEDKNNHKSWEWMKSSAVCSYLGISKSNIRLVGKELKQLADDNLIQRRVGRSRSVEYYLPTISIEQHSLYSLA